MATSINEVAKKANVSISTVSRVLNRRELVNEKTRERVETAIRELGYRPNAFARGLMLRRSELLCLILPDLHGEFYSEIIRGANQAARRAGYHLVVSSFRDSHEGTGLLSAFGQRSIVDGAAVMTSEVNDQIARVLSDFRQPFVMLDGDIDGLPHDSVLIDQSHGAQLMMQHLIRDCGARRVIFVGGLETNFDTQARFAEYRSALAAAKLPLNPHDVYHLDYQYETAYSLATRYVREWAGRGHCVFAANDEMAAGIVAAATQAALKVPGDLAVVGFDDTRVARMTQPPLTTIRVPMSEMGARAIEVLCQRLADPKRPPTRVSLKPELVVRKSCGG